MTIMDSQAGHHREANRERLAGVINRDPAALPDELALNASLGLDSLAMMSVLVWLREQKVVVDDSSSPMTVGEILTLLDQQRLAPDLTIRVRTDDTPAGPASLPELPVSKSPLVPVLTLPGFELIPVRPDDTEFLFWLACQPETGFRWRYRGAPPSYERFVADLWGGGVLVQSVVWRSDKNEPIGHIVAYGASASMRYAYLGAVFAPAHTGTGLAAQTVTTFVRYLFHIYPLHKLYLEVPGFNWAQLKSGADRLFTVEGVLRGHDYYAGQYWDKRVCAIYRENVPAT